MSDTPETVNVQAVPTLHGLRHYLDYQYPPTRGDILLNKICNQIAELERERDALKVMHTAEMRMRMEAQRERNEARTSFENSQRDFKNYVEQSAIEKAELKAERDQLRKVVDSMARQYRHEMMSMFGHAADCDCSRCEPMTKLYNSLPRKQK